MLRVLAPAKVNLHLSVGSVRPDGYHDLTSVFHTLDLADEVSIAPADTLSLVCDPDVGVPAASNLAYRAALAAGVAFGREPLAAIALTKRIPHGAGLGGGSSDAAAVIAGLATLWGEDPLDTRCLDAARSIGADVPFFLAPSGAALMTGRGDEVDRALPALAGAPVVLVRPIAPVPTIAAYAAFDADPQPTAAPDAVVSALEGADVDALAGALFNNLAPAAFAVVPEVADALAWVSASDAVLGAAVSGSGSAVFALCGSADATVALAADAASRGWWSCATALGGSGVRIA